MDNILNFKIKNEEVLKQENIKSFSPNHLDKKTIDDSDLFDVEDEIDTYYENRMLQKFKK